MSFSCKMFNFSVSNVRKFHAVIRPIAFYIEKKDICPVVGTYMASSRYVTVKSITPIILSLTTIMKLSLWHGWNSRIWA